MNTTDVKNLIGNYKNLANLSEKIKAEEVIKIPGFGKKKSERLENIFEQDFCF